MALMPPNVWTCFRCLQELAGNVQAGVASASNSYKQMPATKGPKHTREPAGGAIPAGNASLVKLVTQLDIFDASPKTTADAELIAECDRVVQLNEQLTAVLYGGDTLEYGEQTDAQVSELYALLGAAMERLENPRTLAGLRACRARQPRKSFARPTAYMTMTTARMPFGSLFGVSRPSSGQSRAETRV
jgi:hypothetical protein